MTQRITYVLTAVMVLFAATAASAQKYPERGQARKGNKSYFKDNFEGAEVWYRRALETHAANSSAQKNDSAKGSKPASGGAGETFPEATFNLGDALFKLERNEDAAEAFRSVAADSTVTPELAAAANFNLGNSLLAAEKIDEAIEAYKSSLRLNPTDNEAKFNLAYAQKLKRQKEQEQQNQGGGGQQNKDKNEGDKGDQGDEQQDRDDQQKNGDNQKNDGQNKPENGNNDQQQPPPDGSGKADGEAKIDPSTAAQMLEAVQGEEDKTREKINAREVQTGSRSGKNW